MLKIRNNSIVISIPNSIGLKYIRIDKTPYCSEDRYLVFCFKNFFINPNGFFCSFRTGCLPGSKMAYATDIFS